MCSKQFLKPVILRCERLTAIVGAPLCAVDLYRHSALPVKSDYQRVYLTGMSNMTGVLLLTDNNNKSFARPSDLGFFPRKSWENFIPQHQPHLNLAPMFSREQLQVEIYGLDIESESQIAINMKVKALCLMIWIYPPIQ